MRSTHRRTTAISLELLILLAVTVVLGLLFLVFLRLSAVEADPSGSIRHGQTRLQAEQDNLFKNLAALAGAGNCPCLRAGRGASMGKMFPR